MLGILPDNITASFTHVKGSISKSSTASMKKLFNFSATSFFSVYTMSLSIIVILFCNILFLSENNGLICCQKVLLSSNNLMSKLL